MPRTPSDDVLNSHRPTLSVDWEFYAAMLEESDLTPAEQKELIETLWSIVVAFVDLGFDLHPVQQICGEGRDPLAEGPPDIVSLIERDLTTAHREAE